MYYITPQWRVTWSCTISIVDGNQLTFMTSEWPKLAAWCTGVSPSNPRRFLRNLSTSPPLLSIWSIFLTSPCWQYVWKRTSSGISSSAWLERWREIVLDVARILPTAASLTAARVPLDLCDLSGCFSSSNGHKSENEKLSSTEVVLNLEFDSACNDWSWSWQDAIVVKLASLF